MLGFLTWEEPKLWYPMKIGTNLCSKPTPGTGLDFSMTSVARPEATVPSAPFFRQRAHFNLATTAPISLSSSATSISPFPPLSITTVFITFSSSTDGVRALTRGRSRGMARPVTPQGRCYKPKKKKERRTTQRRQTAATFVKGFSERNQAVNQDQQHRAQTGRFCTG